MNGRWCSSPPTAACPTASRGCRSPPGARSPPRPAASCCASSRESRARNDPALRQLGPDPLRPGLRPSPRRPQPAARARRGPRDRRRAARPADRSPGSATRSASRRCSRARVSPWRKVDDLSEDELELRRRRERAGDAGVDRQGPPAPRDLPRHRTLPDAAAARSAPAARATTTAPPTGARAARSTVRGAMSRVLGSGSARRSRSIALLGAAGPGVSASRATPAASRVAALGRADLHAR